MENIENSNYVVRIQDFNGLRVTRCDTLSEVTEAFKGMAFGGLYSVTSDNGCDVSQFIPF